MKKGTEGVESLQSRIIKGVVTKVNFKKIN